MNKEVIELIRVIWKANPYLRFNQLIGNCFSFGDLYYVEDDVLIKRLKEVYLKENKDATEESKK